MLPDQIGLRGYRQSTAVVNRLTSTVFVPLDDPTTRALDSVADGNLLDLWILQTHKDLDAPDPDAACWNWGGPLNEGGYGVVRVPQNVVGRYFHVGAHRVAWTVEYGTIPRWALIDGRLHRVVLDHVCCGLDVNCPGGRTCRHRQCQNVGHMDLVSNGENVRRGKGLHGEKAAQVAAEARRRQRGV
ncbi:hypothetical protein [Streptomyces sp. P5_D11]